MSDGLDLDAAIAERIAQRIESEMQYEGVRAQRVMKMCAAIARREGLSDLEELPEPEVPARRRGKPGVTDPDTRGYMGGV